jgi:hypothetical protein
MNTTQEIIKTVQSLPVSEQQKVLRALQGSLQRKTKLRPEVSEDDVEMLLLAEGLISEIPDRLPDDEEETYEPITVGGTPVSEMILENREQ